jgi:hypothetical protein
MREYSVRIDTDQDVASELESAISQHFRDGTFEIQEQ